ncbi:MAG: carboxymuconolactone decarboxylase family protein [Candidatus Abyssubacteria bacterium]|nr:carboxymuconolactone decarboxylase family protein [Candidatus Abyssubacteria bacterium]
MTRIPYADIDKTPQKVRNFFDKMRANTDGAEIMNIFKMAAHSDASVREFVRLGNRLLMKAHLDARFRELAILRIAQMLGARYEWAQHVPIAMGTGLTRDQIKELEGWRESSLFDDNDKTVLGYTEEVVRDSRPQEETFAAASNFLDHSSLVELTLSIGYWSMVAKFLKTFRVDVEEQFLEQHGELLDDVGLIDL